MKDKDNFKIAIDVLGIKANDLNVNVGHRDHVLNIKGERKVKIGEEVSTSKFKKSFTISSYVDVKDIKAVLSEGVLVIDAPKLKL